MDVYGRYSELVNVFNKPTNITGGHHPVGAFLLNIHHSKLEHVGLCALANPQPEFSMTLSGSYCEFG
jgi:hypothetical protein